MQQTQLTTFQTKILIGIFLFIVFITLKCNEEPDGYSLCGEALL